VTTTVELSQPKGAEGSAAEPSARGCAGRTRAKLSRSKHRVAEDETVGANPPSSDEADGIEMMPSRAASARWRRRSVE
jgi:hypothetical protein